MKKTLIPEELLSLGFSPEDIIKFNQIVKLEEMLALSSSLAAHLKDPSKATGGKVSIDSTMYQEREIIGSMSNVEVMIKSYNVIVKLREHLFVPESIILHFGIIELAQVACNSMNLVTISTVLPYVEKCLVVNSRLMNLEDGTKINNMLVIKALNNLGGLHSKIGNDTLLTTEYYKQAWLIGRKTFPENSIVSNLKTILDKLEPGFTASENPSCLYITTRRVTEEDNFLILKAALMSKILSKIPKLVQEGTWSKKFLGSDFGLKGYINSEYVIKILTSTTHCTAKDIENAQMLCFETVCAATLAAKNKNGTKCLIEFIKAYPSLVSRVLGVHPEYCLDGKIVKTCIDTFTLEKFEFLKPELVCIDIALSGATEAEEFKEE